MTETQTKSFFSCALGLAVLLFCLAAVPGEVRAEADFYVIRNISVDETADSATTARTVAVANGQKRAFAALLRRLVPAGEHSRLPQLDDASITALVASFQVANERSSATRYLADLTFEFKRDDVRSLLRARQLPFSEAIARPILVLPVYIEGEKANLWNMPNPWREIWTEVVDYGLRPKAPDALRDDWAQPFVQPVLMPAGDLADIRLLDAEMALGMDPVAITTLQRNYEVAAVHVISARPRQSADGAPLLDVTWKKSGSSTDSAPQVFRGSADHAALMQSAVFELLRQMQEDWKQRNVLDFSTETVLAVTSRVRSLDEWLRLQRQVESLSNVSAVRLRDLSVGEAFWNITYIGSIEQLTAALERRDIELVDHQGYWTIDFR